MQSILTVRKAPRTGRGKSKMLKNALVYLESDNVGQKVVVLDVHRFRSMEWQLKRNKRQFQAAIQALKSLKGKMAMILSFLMICPLAHAEEKDINTVFLGYTEAEDCKEPSERIEVVDGETGVVSYIVKSPCTISTQRAN